MGVQYTTEMEVTTSYYNDTPKKVWNDSEAIAIEVAMFIEDYSNKIDITNGSASLVMTPLWITR